MTELNMPRLLGEKYPFATFHDGFIQSIHLDYVKREAVFRCELFVGNAESDDKKEREATAGGVLTFSGLLFFVAEAPQDYSSYDDERGLDVFKEGPLKIAEGRTTLPKLPADLPDEAFVHYFYINNCGSEIYVAATGAQFVWDEPV